MESQIVVSGIESVTKDISDFIKLSGIIDDFFKVPHSKSEIRNFSEKYLLDNFLTSSELMSLYSKLTIEKTLFNNNIAVASICKSNFTFKQSLNKFKLKIKKCLSNTLLLIVETNNDIVESPIPNRADLLQALLDKVNRINSIFQTARQLPVEVNQIDSLPINEDNKSHSIAEFITSQKDIFNSVIANLDLSDLVNAGSDSTYIVNPYLCKNNWISLRNLIISFSDI